MDADCPPPELVKTRAHICFEVDDLDVAMAERQVLVAPISPVPELRTAFIVPEGAPIEFLQIL